MLSEPALVRCSRGRPASLDLFVDEGEFVVLVGPSCCGKTTALRMVAGLEEITTGTIRLDGKVVNDLTPKARDAAMVFQNYALYPHMSVHENIGFSLEMRGVGKAARDRKIREAADVLGLSEVLDRKPRQLSAGQRQRVAMGRALVREPAVFLMDEPLSNLDAQLRVQMRSEVLRVQRHLGVATLYGTHDQTEAMTMGDRVAILRAGVLQQLAPPQELYDQPANLFVASFMGSPTMNLYEASIGGSAEQRTVSIGSQQLTLPLEVGRRVPSADGDARRVVVGIRPEHLSVPIPGVQAEEGRRLEADVELVEPLGNEVLAHFALDAPRFRHETEASVASGTTASRDGGGIAGASIAEGIARIDPRSIVKAGEPITFAVDVDRLHFFDPTTGTSLRTITR